MSEKTTLRFASSAWWAEHPRTNPAVVHAILSLSTSDRTPEQIWLSPTCGEWRQVAEFAAAYSDDGESALTGEQISWRILSKTI
jgi:hypothetical protein